MEAMKVLIILALCTIVQAFSVLNIDSDLLRRAIERRGSPSRAEPSRNRGNSPQLEASDVQGRRISPQRSLRRLATADGSSKVDGESPERSDGREATRPISNQSPGRSPSRSPGQSPKCPNSPRSQQSEGRFTKYNDDGTVQWEPRNPTPADQLLPVRLCYGPNTQQTAWGTVKGGGIFTAKSDNAPREVTTGHLHEVRGQTSAFMMVRPTGQDLGSTTGAIGRHSVKLRVGTRHGGSSKIEIRRPGSPLRSFTVPENMELPMEFVNPRPELGVIAVQAINTPEARSVAKSNRYP